MPFANYGQLKDAVAGYLNRTDLSSAMDDMVAIVTADLRRRLRGVATATETLSISSETTALPSDLQEPRSLTLSGPTYFGPIELVTPGKLSELKEWLPNSGVPKFGTIRNRTLYVAPVPTTAQEASLVYFAEIEDLSASGDSNWLLLAAPDVYLHGMLEQAERYLKNDERAAMWRGDYEKAIRDLEIARDRREYGADSPVIRPSRPIG